MNKSKVAHQGQQEMKAGYRSGLAGDPRPAPDKGRSFYLGWMNGNADYELSKAVAPSTTTKE